jgi:hypothetical protein
MLARMRLLMVAAGTSLSVPVFGNDMTPIPPAVESEQTSAKPWLAWDTPEGKTRLERTEIKAPLLNLLRYYETQSNLNFCGVATAVVALNALGVERPVSEIYGPYQIYNQTEIFTGKTGEVISENEVKRNGISLSKMRELFRAIDVPFESFEAVHTSPEQLRQVLIESLKDPKKIAIVLYARSIVEQDGKGHWSPIAAYDEESDSFLLMDVAKYKYPPSWIQADALIQAMKTKDIIGRPRGLMILQKPSLD